MSPRDSRTPKWFLAGMGPLLLLQGFENLIRRHDIPFGIVQLVIGGASILALIRNKPVSRPIFYAMPAVVACAAIAEIYVGRWIWGLFVLTLAAVVALLVSEDQRRRRSSTPPME